MGTTSTETANQRRGPPIKIPREGQASPKSIPRVSDYRDPCGPGFSWESYEAGTFVPGQVRTTFNRP